MRKIGFVLGTASMAVVLVSCGGGGGGSSPVAPAITVSITSGSSGPMTVQLTRTFTATVTNSSNQSVTWSVVEGAAGGSITSGGVYTAPATAGTFTVKATAAADASASATVSVQVVAAPSITSFNASPTVVYPTLTATSLTAVFSNGNGSINQGVGAVTSGTPVILNPTTTTTYTLTVTNAAGATTSSDRQVMYETQAPTLGSFTANPPVVPYGQPSVLSWVLGGGVPNQLTINTSISVLGQSSYTVFPTRRESWYLTASNPNGSTGNNYTYVIGQGLEAFAGSVLGGWGAEDGTGSAARTYYPDGMACDAQGNVYLTDYGMNTIRKITPAGVSTTLAGSPGQRGSTDGVGASARFNIPLGIIPDPSGNLFVCDRINHTIRKVAPDGTVTTFAGGAGISGNTDGTGTAARFNNPWGIVRDSAGNLFVSDSGNHTIRKITPAGVVSTFAGLAGVTGFINGLGNIARFYYPYHLGIDGADNIYVADDANHSIRKITSGGLVSTLAGNGASGSADRTGAGAQFYSPIAVVADLAGNVYVGDTSNCTIRKITPGGVVTTLAGVARQPGTANGVGTAARFNYIWSLAIDPSGNLYAGDDSNHAVRKIAPDATVTTFIGKILDFGSTDGSIGAARFFYPDGLCVGGQFDTYLADTSNHTIRKISGSGVVTTIAGSPGVSGNVDAVGSAARFSSPRGITLDGSGNLYVCDYGNHRIRKITPDGTVSTYAGSTAGFTNGTGAAAQFYYPSSITRDAGGNLYVSDTYNHSIRKVASGGVVTTLVGNGTAGSADGTGATARFQYPRGVSLDSLGNVYVADTNNQAIRKITPGGVVSTLAGTMGTFGFADGVGAAALFNYPQGVAVDPTGNVWVSDTNNRSIRKIAPGGVVSTLLGSATTFKSATPGSFANAGVGYPYGIAWWPAGDLLFTTEHGVMIVTGPNGN